MSDFDFGRHAASGLRAANDAREATVSVDLTERELHVLTCAMAGNFPSSLSDVRMPVLRKLAKAHHAVINAADERRNEPQP